MKVLFICGVFPPEYENDILKNSKNAVEHAANNFQKKLINGFVANKLNFSIISAPLIGSYPNAYKKISFKGFKDKKKNINYVNFNNIWGFRNFSRSWELKKAVKSFILEKSNNKIIIVYSPHTPFLEAAVYAKKKDPSIKICLVTPDVPQYMNLNEKKSLLYHIGKIYDIRRFNKLNKNVDSYMLLTEQMKNILKVGEKPYIVVEGIVDQEEAFYKAIESINKEFRYIVYLGKMYHKFGIVNLINAFHDIESSDLKLVLCGTGDAVDFIESAVKKDSRIIFEGQVSHDKAKQWISLADVLVNPRQNNEEYTKYSFPSKNIEYLSSGKPVVGYLLDGMKEDYKEFMYITDGSSIINLRDTIVDCLNDKEENKLKKIEKFLEYKKNIENTKVVMDIISITKNTL